MQQSYDLEKLIVLAVKDFAKSIRAGNKVVADMSSLIDATAQLTLANLDYWEGLMRDQFFGTSWKRHSSSAQLITWLDLISWDGYRREKALRTISSAAPNGFFFSLVLRRLNDWVPQVREAARESLPIIAQKTNPEYVAQVLYIVLSHWHSWGRIEEQGKQILLDIITYEEIAKALRAKLIYSTAGSMPSLFAQLGRTPILDEHLDDIAKNAVQPWVRAKAYRSQFEGRIVWVKGHEWEWLDFQKRNRRLKAVIAERKLTVTSSCLELLSTSSHDRSSIVRRVAAEFLIRDLESLGDEALTLAQHFATDKSRAVKERGQFALKRLKEMQPQ
ncbi:hypothetical protein [Candidatus Albibeggiatoa sp. nov. NOAA]|uniref:hypothetical protein n=1 Tax=Candidatus Albibeggiatoa sp. nov. NOAA TaxID=3162724 RepID=UPI0032F11A41|nr:hypothetical protein [Thiotrichaceae bacterium]